MDVRVFIKRHQNLLAGTVVFLLAFVPRLVFSLQINPFSMVYDEFSTISGAALLYPMDWTEALATSYRYYGGGFSVFYAVLFRVFDDPLVIWHIILGILSALQAFGTVIAFVILRKHFKSISLTTAVLLAVSCGYIVGKRSSVAINESVLCFLAWVILWLLFELADTQPRSIKNRGLSALLAVVSVYSLTVHERMIILLPMLAFLWLMVWIGFKKSAFSPLSFGISYVPLWFLANRFKQAIIACNFPEADGVVKNSELRSNGLSLLADPSYWKTYVLSISGTLATAALVTGGAVLLGLVLSGKFGIQTLFQRDRLRSQCQESDDTKIYIGTIFLAAGILATVLYQGLGWLSELNLAFSKGYDTNFKALRAVAHIRYYGHLIGPICMVVLLWFLREKEGKNRLLPGIAFLIGGILSAVWILKIYPYIRVSTSAREHWVPFSIGERFVEGTGYTGYRGGFIVLLIFLILLLLLFSLKKLRIYILLMGMLAVWQYAYLALVFDVNGANEKGHIIDTYHAVEAVDINGLTDEIYVPESDCTIYQFLFYDTRAHVGLPTDSKMEEGIVFAKQYKSYNRAIGDGWRFVVLDGEKLHSVFIKGEKIIDAFEKAGYRLIDFKKTEYMLLPEDFSSGEGAFRTGSSLSAPQGGYEAVLDADRPEDWDLVLINTSSGRTVVNKAFPEDGKMIFSVPSSITGKIELKNRTNENDRFRSLYVNRVSREAVAGDSSDRSTDTVVEILKEVPGGSLFLYSNQQDPHLDLSLLEQKAERRIAVADERELLDNRADYVLCFTDSDWLCLLPAYEVDYLDSAFVLLKRPAAGEDGSNYVSIKADSGIRRELTEGTYRFRIVPGKGVPKNAEDYTCVLTAGSNGKIIAEVPAATGDGVYFCDLTLTETIKKWSVTLQDASGKEMKTKSVEVCKPVSQTRAAYQQIAEGLSELMRDNPDARAVVACQTDGVKKDLIRALLDPEGQNTDGIIYEMDASKMPAVPDADIIVWRDNTSEILAFVEQGYDVLAYSGHNVLLAKDIMIRGSIPAENGYFRSGMLTDAFFAAKGEGDPAPDLLPGTYAFVFEPGTVPGECAVYAGEEKVLSGESLTIIRTEDCDTVCFNCLTEQAVSVRSADGQRLAGKLLGIRKCSIFETSSVEGGVWSVQTRNVTGTGTLKICSNGMRVVKSKPYRVTVRFSGDVKAITLASIDDEMENNKINKTAEEYTTGDNGIKEIILEVTPSYSRIDRLELTAEFDGAFSIESVIIK